MFGLEDSRSKWLMISVSCRIPETYYGPFAEKRACIEPDIVQAVVQIITTQTESSIDGLMKSRGR